MKKQSIASIRERFNLASYNLYDSIKEYLMRILLLNNGIIEFDLSKNPIPCINFYINNVDTKIPPLERVESRAILNSIISCIYLKRVNKEKSEVMLSTLHGNIPLWNLTTESKLALYDNITENICPTKKKIVKRAKNN